MKKGTISKLLSITLALSMTLGSGSMAVFAEDEAPAAEEVEAAVVVEEEADAAQGAAAAEEADAAAETSETEVEMETVLQPEAEAAAPAKAEPAEEVAVEITETENDTEETEAAAEEETEAKDAGLEEAPELTEAMESTSIGGVTYFYADTKDDDPATVYQATVRSRTGVTVYNFSKADLIRVGETDYYYGVAAGVTLLTGTLYGYKGGNATNYRAVYGELGVSADESYDVISSATKFSGNHAKDIPSLVTYGTDTEENKAITGLLLGRETETIDAVAHVEAVILKAAGETLTDEQKAAAAVVLKTNPMQAPSAGTIKPVLSSAAYTTSRYGTGEFAIVPDDTVEGYLWDEYWNSVYAATISDGTTTAGAVHWIDLYGEATNGNKNSPHYNKLEIALNNGESVGSNKANVSRYAAFYDVNTNNLKAGTYHVKIYAEGYDTLEAEIEVKAEAMESTSIGGVTYFYADTKDDDPATVYQATVRSRTGVTVYNYSKADLTRVGETDYYYGVAAGVTPLTGTLYGYKGGNATNYRAVYGELGVSADESYDVISSATKFSGNHAKDIPSLVTYGKDAEGNKAITGLLLEREKVTVEAKAHVEAGILNAAGETLTDEQAAAAAVVLKANPMKAPSESTIKPVLSSAAYTTSRYGTGEFAIVPDDTVEGYQWDEYWNSVYAATISDGTTTAGAVHWIDLYGEATNGNKNSPHYNKLEIALNNGESVGSNKANVSRYAKFYDDAGNVKDGTYTIKVYAEGYDVLEAAVEITAAADQAAAENAKALIEAANGKFATAAEAQQAVDAAKKAYDALTPAQKDILSKAMENAEELLSKAQTAATAQKTAEENAEKKTNNKTDNKTDNKTQTVTKQSQSLKKLTPATKKLKASRLKKKKQTYQLKAVINGQGKVTFKKLSGNKKIKISKAGKVTVKKGLKKGTYKVKVQVSIAAAGNYSAASAIRTIKIKVK